MSFPCQEICNLPKHREVQRRVVEGAAPHTPYSHLSHQQMRRVLESLRIHDYSPKNQGLNLQHKFTTSLHRLDDFEQLVMVIATSDAPRLRQIIPHALDRNVSIHAILELVRGAIQGVRRVYDYEEKEIDPASLVQHLGG
ncbi:hypothetical protein B0H10DRAFT_1831713 [Mycena sp. CBHHK59/15]|nr:hypothetical protein B0H10DRAFT_1831713 [Mycena sp. CBHHK59/15]